MAVQLQTYSPRITGVELPRNGKSILIVKYTVQDKGNGDYQVVLQGEKPFVEMDWLRQDGTITPEMLNLLVPQDAVRPLNANNTYVSTNLDSSYFEGLRRLLWVFGDRGRPGLGSDWVPRVGGALLGSVAEGDDRLKIDDIEYFVQPEVALRGKNLWEIRLYTQDNGMIHSLSQAVNAAARFTIPEKVDGEWVRSEVERFEKNGAGLKERQVEDRYRQLRNHIWKSYAITAGEMLAWPIMPKESPPSEDIITVPRSEYERYKTDSETLDRIRQLLR